MNNRLSTYLFSSSHTLNVCNAYEIVLFIIIYCNDHDYYAYEYYYHYHYYAITITILTCNTCKVRKAPAVDNWKRRSHVSVLVGSFLQPPFTERGHVLPRVRGVFASLSVDVAGLRSMY